MIGGAVLWMAPLVAAWGLACSPFAPPLGEEPSCIALALHPGVVGEQEFEMLVGEAVADVAVNGGKIRAWAVTRSGASPRPLEVGADGGRELQIPPARDSDAGRGDAVDAVVGAVGRAAEEGGVYDFDEGPPLGAGTATSADLFGTLGFLGREASEMSGCDTKAGVLATGGGIHRTSDLDLLDLDQPGAGRPPVVDPAGLGPPPDGVRLAVYGAGHFVGVDPEVSSSFAAAVESTWREVCADLCTVKS